MAEEIKQYFTSYRSPGFTAPAETVPQETTPLDSIPQIQPDGWVINSTANVFIDADGLHIYDGALYLIDIAGSSVLGPGGFSGSWSGFISAGGIYNSQFSSGTLGDLIVTEVGTGGTTADYEASLSAQLPYWIVTEDDYNALSLVADSGAPSGQAVEVDTSVLPNTEPVMTAIFYQDVAVSPSKSYIVEVWIKGVNSPSGRMRIEASWRDADHALIATPLGHGYGWYVNGISALAYEPYLFQIRTSSSGDIGEAPPNAAYLRLKIGMGGSAANAGAVRIGSVYLHDESPVMGRIILHNRTSWDDSIPPAYIYSDGGAAVYTNGDGTYGGISLSSSSTGGVIKFGSPNLADFLIALTRRGAGRLRLSNGYLESSQEDTDNATGGWATASLQNSWVAYGPIDGTSYGTLQYRKDAMGFVHLRGLVKNGSSLTARISTLPVGYRPSTLMLFPTMSADQFCRLDIDATGNVQVNPTPAAGGTAWVSFNGITFKAA